MPSRAALRTAALVAGPSGLLVLVRVWLALTPLLSETYYDEAITGLMGLAILRGVPQVFYWGQPYLGAVDAYLASLGFALVGPSTLVLRLTTCLTTVLWCWAMFDLARRIAGERAGLLAGVYLALPPVFLVYVQLSSHGESVAMSFGAAALALAARLADRPAGDGGWRVPAWLALGLSAGLAWWGSQMTAMLLLGGGAVLLVARPATLREPGPYLAGAGFVVASLPFWVWNLGREWSTFTHLLSWGSALPRWPERVLNVVTAFVKTARGVFWDSREVTLSPRLDALGIWVVGAFYGPAVLLAVARLLTWMRRLARKSRPWQDPLDAVVLAFWATVTAHLLTWFGTSGVIRYSLTFYGTVPVLGAVALARVGRLGRAGGAVAVAAAVALLAYHGAQATGFVRLAAAEPVRPVDAALARMSRLGLSACYADSRIAQVLSFESAGRVTCADFLGLRDYASLQAVDGVADPATVALVTHRTLRHPEPDVLAAALDAAGIDGRRDEVGDYVIFHGFSLRPASLRPVERTGWSARAGTAGSSASLAFDRRAWTRWVGPQAPGMWFQLDLGRVVRVGQVTLEGGNPVFDAPSGLIVETSTDGAHWDVAARLHDVQPGLSFWRGRPRIDESARVIVRMVPRPTRQVRLTRTGPEIPGRGWGLAEVFVYETAPPGPPPPTAATLALAEADRLLARWMDDPTGAHPKRAPVTYPHRRAQVDWAAVSRSVNRALDLAPEWEEAHHLYTRVLDLAHFSIDPEAAVDRARRDRAWPEVVHAAALAEALRPGLWRAGRDRAAAEGLAFLGHLADAEARTGQAAPEAETPVPVEFGPGLTLLGVDLPAAGRRGQPLTLVGHWQLHGTAGGDFSALVTFVGPAGRRFGDEQILGDHGYPSSRWPPDERIRQPVTLVVPDDLPPGPYTVRIGVGLPQTGKRLRVTRTAAPLHGRSAEVGQVVIAR